MKFLTLAQLSRLMDIEAEFDCQFLFPPLHKDINCCFFDINEIQNNSIKFQKFLVEVKKTKVKHKFVDVDDKKFMAVMR